jgi:hypothetical protein
MESLLIIFIACLIIWLIAYGFYIIIIGAISILSKHLLVGLLVLILLPVIFVIWAFVEGISG